jgi:2-polyprenyl-6-methoxyphenol hydroxylase-like FAD-dependent oxidoreductase
MYDVIVIGARAAGASTAMLLARRGLRVLAVDRASFPSDTLSTHQIQVPGSACLARWGVLDKVLASGAPPARRMRFDQPGVSFTGDLPTLDGIEGIYSPRRVVLDEILVDAARQAGAEVRENVIVAELSTVDGRVTGIRGTSKSGGRFAEAARIVVGADGKNSFVARTVHARMYRERPARTVACYSYWAGVPVDGGEVYARDGRGFGVWPTNDGLVVVFVCWPAAEFGRFRADVEGNVLATLDLAEGLGERIRAGKRVERFRSTPDVPNVFRVPYGPGWALAGDAGLVMDPLTAQGIGHAFRDAELLSGAITAGLDGKVKLDKALRGYHRTRDRQTKPMYDLTTGLARLAPQTPASRALFTAIAQRPDAVAQFLGVLTGTVPVARFFNPASLIRIAGLRTALAVMKERPRP